MSTHKTELTLSDAKDFLSGYFNDAVTSVSEIGGGETSKAFFFKLKDADYVLRVNSHGKENYLKDKFAYQSFASRNILIPEVIEIGDVNESLSFCITKKCSGITLDQLDEATNKLLVPKVVAALLEVHQLKAPGTGYGNWGSSGNGKFKSWNEFLNASLGTDEDKLKNVLFYDKDLRDKLKFRIKELIKYCPEERVVIHDDFGFNNTLSDGKNITGIIDWEESIYGDPVRDLARLELWGSEYGFAAEYKKQSKRLGIKLQNFERRLECYKLMIALGSLWFYAYSNQEESYRNMVVVVEGLGI